MPASPSASRAAKACCLNTASHASSVCIPTASSSGVLGVLRDNNCNRNMAREARGPTASARRSRRGVRGPHDQRIVTTGYMYMASGVMRPSELWLCWPGGGPVRAATSPRPGGAEKENRTVDGQRSAPSVVSSSLILSHQLCSSLPSPRPSAGVVVVVVMHIHRRKAQGLARTSRVGGCA